jgi:hypothetical protein
VNLKPEDTRWMVVAEALKGDAVSITEKSQPHPDSMPHQSDSTTYQRMYKVEEILLNVL